MCKDLNPGLSDFKVHVLSITASCLFLKYVLLFTVSSDELEKRVEKLFFQQFVVEVYED